MEESHSSKSSSENDMSDRSETPPATEFRRGEYSPPILDEGVNIDKNNVFVKYLPKELTDSGLCAIFSTFGEITSYKVMLDPITGNSLGYGFVHFSKPEEALSAVQNMNRARIGNKVLLCKLSYGIAQNNAVPNNNLYIKPLPKEMNEEDLKILFAPHGDVIRCKVMSDKNKGSSMQIGFVMFRTISEATNALVNLNGYVMGEGHSPIFVRYAESNIQRYNRRLKILNNQLALVDYAGLEKAWIRHDEDDANVLQLCDYPADSLPPSAEKTPEAAVPHPRDPPKNFSNKNFACKNQHKNSLGQKIL